MSTAGTTTTEGDPSVPVRSTGGRHAAPDPGSDLAPATSTWRRSWTVGAFVWLVTHAVFATVMVLNRALGGGRPGGSALGDWMQWDSGWYANIATGGYGFRQGDDLAFFPLYPLVARAVDMVLPGEVLVALMVVSNLAGLGALVLLHRLLATEFDGPVADRTVYLFGFFPTAYFLATPYNHSFFLLLTLGFLYALRQRQWWVAGAIGALASATRSAGIFLVLPFAFEYLRVRGFRIRQVRFDGAAIALIPVGLAAYAIYCWSAFGDPLGFSHAQAYWNKQFAWPGYTLWAAVEQLFDRSLMKNYHLVADLLGTLLGLALLVACLWGRWRLPRHQWYLVVFAAPVFLLPLFFPVIGRDNPVSGTARYLLDIAVLFVLIGRAAVARPAVERSYIPIAVAVQVGFLLMYLQGEWTF